MALAHDRLIRKLESTSDLTAEDALALRGLPLKTRRVEGEEEVVREGDRPSDCCLLVEGMLVRQKTTPSGRRQIMSVHVPGDLPDLQSLHLDTMDHAISAVGPGTVAFIPNAAVKDFLQRRPRLAEAFARDALIDAAIHREWLCNIGARSAYQRTSHLLCEVFLKMKAVGLATERQCPFPLTQRDLADCMGLSSVHVNRTLQQLRMEELIQLSDKLLTIFDLEALQSAGEFDPTYLHLRRAAA